LELVVDAADYDVDAVLKMFRLHVSARFSYKIAALLAEAALIFFKVSIYRCWGGVRPGIYRLYEPPHDGLAIALPCLRVK